MGSSICHDDFQTEVTEAYLVVAKIDDVPLLRVGCESCQVHYQLGGTLGLSN